MTRDVVWILLRMVPRNLLPPGPQVNTNDVIVPLWTGFNAQLSNRNNSFTATAYAPIIDAKPADMKTVYTTMIKCKQMTESLGQKTSVQTMDQQLYAISQQVKWADDVTFHNSILRLGGFHTISFFIATIGKLWGSAGLIDILVDSWRLRCCHSNSNTRREAVQPSSAGNDIGIWGLSGDVHPGAGWLGFTWWHSRCYL